MAPESSRHPPEDDGEQWKYDGADIRAATAGSKLSQVVSNNEQSDKPEREKQTREAGADGKQTAHMRRFYLLRGFVGLKFDETRQSNTSNRRVVTPEISCTRR